VTKRKIGTVKRKRGSFVWVDNDGNVWEGDPPKRKRKRKVSRKKK
jgi:hypothetical protein